MCNDEDLVYGVDCQRCIYHSRGWGSVWEINSLWLQPLRNSFGDESLFIFLAPFLSILSCHSLAGLVAAMSRLWIILLVIVFWFITVIDDDERKWQIIINGECSRISLEKRRSMSCEMTRAWIHILMGHLDWLKLSEKERERFVGFEGGTADEWRITRRRISCK